MTLPPCKECKQRCTGCHSKCKKYIEWNVIHQKEKDAEWDRKRINYCSHPFSSYFNKGRFHEQ